MITGPASFASALRDYFGPRKGETLKDFMAELKALNDKDRAYFTDLLRKEGYELP